MPTPQSTYTQQDLQHIPVLNLAIEGVAGSVTPSTANVGKLYRNTSTGNIEFVINSSTVAVLPRSGQIANADIISSAAIALSKLATDPLARANHTGTQLANTISNFDTQVRTSRLDQMAAPTAAVAMNSQKVTGAADPSAATDLTTMQWVQAAISSAINGQDWKDAVRVAMTTNVTLTAPGATLDGVTMATGDRVLLTGQTTASANGIYIWNGAAVTMTRAPQADVSAEVTNGMTVPITAGTHAAQFAILTTADPITLDTTALAFTYLTAATSYTQGTGITITGSSIALTTPVAVANGGTNASTAAGARTSLGTNQAGNVTAIGTLTSGVEANVAHNLGSTSCIFQVRNASTKQVVNIAVRAVDTNNAGVTADVAVTSGTLELVALPVGS